MSEQQTCSRLSDSCPEEPPPPMASPPNPFSSMAGLRTHESEGARQMMHGFQFQFKLTMLWILRALRSQSSADFELSTEDKKLGKFDDFYIKETDSEGQTSVQRFIQVKSSASDKAVEFKDLFNSKSKINMIDLLCSFTKINKSDILQESGDKKFILYTNRKINFDSKLGELKLGEVLTKCEPRDALLDVDCFQFKAQVDKLKALVQELVSVTQQPRANVELFLKYFYICTDNKQEEQLENAIKGEFIISNFRLAEVNKAYNQYFTDIQRWFTLPKGTIVSRVDVERYFSAMRGSMEQKRYFRVLSPSENFHGRAEILDKLKSVLSHKGEKRHKIDTVISGTAGVGKTELVRKFIQLYGDQFEHVIWLNAQSQQTLNTSYYELACYLDIFTQNADAQSNKMSSEVLIMKVHDHLRSHKCLLVFDNATPEFSANPAYLGGNVNHRIILTSQMQSWDCGHEIELTGLTTDEACSLIQNSLTDGFDLSAAIKLAATLSHLPLALQLAISYINEATKRRKIISKDCCFSIEDFLTEFVQNSEKFLNHSFGPKKLDHYKHPLTIAWKMCIDHLRSEKCGEVALELLTMMAYTEPDYIPLPMFSLISPEDLIEAALLLQTYSLIKVSDGFCSIHRLIQQVIQHELTLNRKLLSKTETNCLLPKYITDKSVLIKTYQNILCHPPPATEIYNETLHIVEILKRLHIEKAWTFIKKFDDLKIDFLKQDDVFNFLIRLETPFVACTEQFTHILLEKFNYLVQKTPSFLTTDMLLVCGDIIEHFRQYRKFKETIQLLRPHLHKACKFRDSSRLVETFSFLIFAYHKLDSDKKALKLWDKFIANLQKTHPQILFALCQAFTYKADMLSWQYKFSEAHAIMLKVVNTVMESKSEIIKQGDKIIMRNHIFRTSFSFDANPDLTYNSYFNRIVFKSLVYFLKYSNSNAAIRYLQAVLEKVKSLFGDDDCVLIQDSMNRILGICIDCPHQERQREIVAPIIEHIFTWSHDHFLRVNTRTSCYLAYFNYLERVAQKCLQHKTKFNFDFAISIATLKSIEICNIKISGLFAFFDGTITHMWLVYHTAVLQYITGSVQPCLNSLAKLSRECKIQFKTQKSKQYLKMYKDCQLLRARVMFSEGEVENALQILTECIADTDMCQTFSDTVPYELYRAKIWMDTQKSDEAVQILQCLIKICRNHGLINEGIQFKLLICEVLQQLCRENELLRLVTDDEWMQSDKLNVALGNVVLSLYEKTKYKSISSMIQLYKAHINTFYNKNFSKPYQLSEISESIINDQIRISAYESDKLMEQNKQIGKMFSESWEGSKNPTERDPHGLSTLNIRTADPSIEVLPSPAHSLIMAKSRGEGQADSMPTSTIGVEISCAIDNYEFISKRLAIAFNFTLLRRYEDALRELKVIVKEMTTLAYKGFHFFAVMKNDIERLYKLIVFERIVHHVKYNMKDEHLYNLLCSD